MAVTFGIYVGNSSACIACYKDGRNQIIADANGDRSMSTTVLLTEGEQVVGNAAKQSKNFKSKVVHAKKAITVDVDNFTESTSISDNFGAKLILFQNEPFFKIFINDKEKRFKPNQILSVLFRKLKETAQSFTSIDDQPEAVICIPHCFTNIHTTHFRQAAENGGFKVMRMISESAAALLAYDIGQEAPKDSHNCIVFRHGGQTTTVSLIRVISGMYRIVEEINENFGSDIVTNNLVEYFVKEFDKRWKSNVSSSDRAMHKLYNAAQQIKHSLSTLNSSAASIDSLWEGIDFETTVLRSRLESLNASYFSSCTELIQRILLKNGDLPVNFVILTGAGCRLPYLQGCIKNLFPNAEFCLSIPPEEALALGASKQSGIISCSKNVNNLSESSILTTCTDFELFIKDSSNANITLIEKFTPLPLRKQFQCECNSSALLSFFCTNGKETHKMGNIVIKDYDKTNGLLTIIVHIETDSSLNIHVSSADGSIVENLDFLPNFEDEQE